MFPPFLLISRYISRQYLMWFVVIFCSFMSIVYMLEVAEFLRRTSDKPDVTLNIILKMALFKLPQTAEKIMPFVILFSAMYTLWRMTRSQELIVVRATGMSVWQFLSAVTLVTAGIGVFNVMVFNPIGALLSARYEDMEHTYIDQAALLEIAGKGLWLRQWDGDTQYLLRAETVAADPLRLSPITALLFSKNDHYLGRIDASEAVLKDGYWAIDHAWKNDAAGRDAPQKIDHLRIATDLTTEKIQDSFAKPSTLSFWDLPNFIDALERTGFSSVNHRLYYQSLLALPVLFAAMTLLAASFSRRQVRRGGVFTTILSGVAVGFAIFLLNDIVLALGASQTIPVFLAAWTTPLVSLMFGITALLHLEDG
jgi:lipopolysaccharide export system permease protein